MLERIGQYRSILARPPNTLTFDQLVEELLEHPPGEEAVEYLGAQLDRWPEHEPRIAPWEWLEMILQGQNCPEMQLCTMIEAQDRVITDIYGLIYLMESPHMWRVRWLNMSSNAIDTIQATAIGESEAWTALEHLWLSGCSLTDAGLERILANRVMRLRELDIGSNYLGERAGGYIANSPACANLSRLFWRNAACGRESFSSLCTGLIHLTHLEMGASYLNDARPIDALAQASWLPRLEHLGLARCVFDRAQLEGIALLTGHMSSLRSLDLSEHDELDGGVLLTLVEHLPDSIERLFLSHTAIDDACAHAMIAAPALKHLKILDVAQTRMTAVGTSALRARFAPMGCEVHGP